MTEPFLAITAGQWAAASAVAIWVLQWGLIPHLLGQRGKSPNATLAWLWAILLFPGLGGIVYLLLGTERVQRRHLSLRSDLGKRRAGMEPESGGAFSALPELEKINGFPSVGGNEVELLPDGTAFFPVLLEVIQGAKHHLHLEFYTWAMDKAGRTVRDALTEAAKRGVEVRVLVDEMGSLTTFRRFFRDLEAAGGRFSWFHTFAPFRGRFHLNLRNHRKLVVADGQIALTGGMNIGDEYWGGTAEERPFRDLHVRLHGPVVTQLAEVFAQDWYFSANEALDQPRYYPKQQADGEVDAQVVPGGPDNELNEIQLSTLAAVQRAEDSIWLMTPYFVPEASIVNALQLAAMRGLDVRVLVPQKCDHRWMKWVTRSYYADLLPWGVRIYEYRPRMLHAKVMVIDGECSMCGSANMDVRSLRINFELNVLLSSTRIASELEGIFRTNFDESEEITEEAHEARSRRDRAAEAICRPLASLL